MKIDPAECHPEMDYDAHTSTYAFFLKAAVYGTIATAIVVICLALFVA